MVNLPNFDELSSSIYIFMFLKILPIVLILFTIFIPILVVHYSGPTIDGLVTIFSFGTSFTLSQGNLSNLSAYSSSILVEFLFLFVLCGICITIYLFFTQKDRYASYVNAGSIVILFIIFLNYYMLTTLNGKIISGLTTSVIPQPGFFFLILALLSLFSSSFLNFSPKNHGTESSESN